MQKVREGVPVPEQYPALSELLQRLPGKVQGGEERKMSIEKKEPVDYMDLLAQAAEEEHNGDWTDLLPEQVGGKSVDYTAVAAAWEVQRARMGLENEAEG